MAFDMVWGCGDTYDYQQKKVSGGAFGLWSGLVLPAMGAGE